MKAVTNSTPFTGVAAIDSSITPDQDFYLDEIRLHLDAVGGAGTLTITLNSKHGSEYDVLIVSQDMTLVQDLIYQPDVKRHFSLGDSITVAWANAGGKTYGLEFVYTEIWEVF